MINQKICIKSEKKSKQKKNLLSVCFFLQKYKRPYWITGKKQGIVIRKQNV